MGIIGGLGAVLAAPLAIAASHHDQRDATYVSVIPIGCKVEPGGVGTRTGYFGTAFYNIVVTGKMQAINVSIRERCISPTPVGVDVAGTLPKLAEKSEISRQERSKRTCTTVTDDDPDDVRAFWRDNL